MAKVSCNYITKIKEMKIDDLHQPLVFVVDMINGFVKDGALSDRDILKIVPDIKALLNKVHPSIFICDAHDLNAREFKSFPLHCIKNTEESRVIDELLPYAKNIMYKNSTNAFVNEEIQTFIKEQLFAYRDIVITGCCSDICILQFALCLNTYLNENEMHDKRIIVPINMIETYHIKGVHDSMRYNEIACDLMLANAIDVIEMK
ncbi:MAG: cysteine hydrolase [Erysipelotrichia bacterium]|nr:cysteine hydrolase [Erysipelotrichia bacterium]